MSNFPPPTVNPRFSESTRVGGGFSRRPAADSRISVNTTKPIYRTVSNLIRFWDGRIRALIRMFRGIREECREVIDVTVQPRQRAHRMRPAPRRVAGRICSVEHTGFDQRSRRTGDRRTQRTGDIGIAVVTPHAVGAIDHFAALDRRQLVRFADGLYCGRLFLFGRNPCGDTSDRCREGEEAERPWR
jgi:hypothetical protein